MAIINLRDFYPFEEDRTIEVPDEVAEVLFEAQRRERNYIRCRFWNRAHYSLDAGDGIEHSMLYLSMSPCEAYERKLRIDQLYAALRTLPDKQRQRIYAHYILGITKRRIALADGVDESTVRESIRRGLGRVEKFLQTNCKR